MGEGWERCGGGAEGPGVRVPGKRESLRDPRARGKPRTVCGHPVLGVVVPGEAGPLGGRSCPAGGGGTVVARCVPAGQLSATRAASVG